MKTSEMTTTNLAEFGFREIEEASRLLNTWVKDGLPVDFEKAGVHLMMNRVSGNVFLTNDEFQVAMMNGEKLESFYSCPECGCEGFFEDILEENECCTTYVKEIREAYGIN